MRVPASTSSIGRPPETKRPISSSGRCVAERPMRWTGSPTSRSRRSEAESEVRAALRAGDGMHLVDDDDADRAQRLAGARGEQQEERLGRRDEDVRRALEHRGPLLGRRVPRADGDRLGVDARERPAEVPLDVVVQGLQRADVEHLRALAGAGAVERPEKRGQRLPDPVGAWMSTWLPEAMAGQPCSCAGVGRRRSARTSPASWLKGAARSSVQRTPPASGYGCGLRRLPGYYGAPSHHPLSSLTPKGAPVARASCRDRRDLCRTWRPAREVAAATRIEHGRDPPTPLLHGRRRGRPLPGRGRWHCWSGSSSTSR